MSDSALRHALLLSSPFGTGLEDKTWRLRLTQKNPPPMSEWWAACLLEDGGHVGDLVEEVKLPLVEVFGWTRQRARDLLHHLLQQLPDVGCIQQPGSHVTTQWRPMRRHRFTLIGKDSTQRNKQLERIKTRVYIYDLQILSFHQLNEKKILDEVRF